VKNHNHTFAGWIFGQTLACGICISCLASAVVGSYFQSGVDAYNKAEYASAIESFRKAVSLQPAPGTLQNLGNAEWQSGGTGRAILAWEQSLWLDPFNDAARNNLRFARKAAQIEAPDYAWYEVVSAWLPVNWWAGMAGLSLWLAVGTVVLPGILRWRKATWHQAIAAFGLMVFLLTLPAHWGVHTRMRIGFVLDKNTPLRLTPTEEAQYLTHLASGEPVRCEAMRGKYLLIRTGSQALRGWVEAKQVGTLCSTAETASN